MPHIAVDAMSGDFGASTIIRAIASLVKTYPDVVFHLVGALDVLQDSVARARLQGSPQIVLHHASQVVAMDEAPSQALRGKRDSSMHLAIALLRDGQVDAVVSAGNTGALMAMGKVFLRTISGIDRPAIAAFLPTMTGRVLVLDLGANVDCHPEHLLQFAVMGSVLMEQVHGLARPRIGLLNIGSEEIKGNEQVKEAARLLRTSPLHFIGNVEGSDLYRGTADVVVCDGFVGNVVLKVSEGLADAMGTMLKDEILKSLVSKLGGLFIRGAFKRFKKTVDYAEYGGAPLLGINGVGMICHGGSNAKAIKNAIRFAHDYAKSGLTEHVSEKLSENYAVYMQRDVQKTQDAA